MASSTAGPLEKKVAIVTGASAGIGWATAAELARLGAAVIVQARRRERLDALVQAITAAGGRARAVAGDASRPQEIDWLFGEADAFGRQVGARLEVVIANAGRGLAGGVLSSDLKQWEQVYQLNVLGAAYLMRKAGERFVGQEAGDIVVLGSVAGHNISPFSGFYGSSKWAIGSAAEALRREICRSKVRVTTVKPAIVVSEFQQVAGYTEENFYSGAKKFGPLLDPADVARSIGFVLSQPPHVHISELVIRPVGQDYP